MASEHRASLGAYRSDAELLRATAKVLQSAWKKYVEDKQDLRQYMLLYFTVASNFDSDAQVNPGQAGPRAGDFAREVAALPQAKLEQIKAMGTPRVKLSDAQSSDLPPENRTPASVLKAMARMGSLPKGRLQ